MISTIAVRSSEKSIGDHIKTYYSALKTGQEISVDSLFDSYKRLGPSLHEHLFDSRVDVSVLDYCIARLPPQIHQSQHIIISSDPKLFKDDGHHIDTWVPTSARRRRRQSFFNPDSGTLAFLISSDSDLDDLVNCTIAYQIEKNKIISLIGPRLDNFIANQQYSALKISESEFFSLKDTLGNHWSAHLQDILSNQTLNLKFYSYQDQDYQAVAHDWWTKASGQSLVFDIQNVPVYFVSSNLHSLVNIIGGHVLDRQNQIFNYISSADPGLYQDWLLIKSGQNILRTNDFLYYISSVYFSKNPDAFQKKIDYEQSIGIRTITLNHQLPCNIQIIPVSSIGTSLYTDPYLQISQKEKLTNSPAIIVNIDYPLGSTSYYLLNEILSSLKKLLGVYVVGKAAILTGQIGDVQLPKSVFDERTNNIFNIDNVFNQYFHAGSLQSNILRDQKSISVYGTFLENKQQLENYIQSGFNIIEMESGPYLCSIAHYLNQSFPQNQVFNLHHLPFDFGIVNYASDNPLSQNLGEGELALRGIEPTYLSLMAVVQRIIDLETK